METPAPAQSLDQALQAALGEGGRSAFGPDFAEGTGSVEQPRGSRGRSEDILGRTALLDALASGGSQGISALVSAVRSGDDDVAMYAATALGDARDPAAVPHLIRLVRHPDLNVAQAAIDALGKLRAQSAAASIEAMLEADPWLRFAAAHALGEIGHPGSVSALMRAAGDPTISELAIEALGKIATVSAATALADLLARRVDGESFDECLLALGTALSRMVDLSDLQDCSAWRRLGSTEASAVHARLVAVLVCRDVATEGALDRHLLGEAAIAVIRALAIPALYPALIDGAWDVTLAETLLDAVLFAAPATHACVLAGLGHADADVRAFCCEAAGAMGIEEAIGPCERLLDSKEAWVRVAAVRALADLKADRALPAMLRCLADPVEPVRTAAVRSLGTMDANLVTGALLSNAELASTHTALALEVMHIAPCVAQREYVLRALTDARDDARRAAVAVMGAKEDAEVIDVLEPMLRDPSSAVRAEVVQAFGRRRSPRAQRLLLDQFACDVEIREHILRALGHVGDGWAARRLMGLFPEQEPAIRLAMVDALGAIAAPVAEPFLAQLLADPHPEIRGRAAVAIGHYASDGAVTRLAHAARDESARVRLAALESLSAFASRPAAVEAFERMCLDPVPAIAALARRCLRKS